MQRRGLFYFRRLDLDPTVQNPCRAPGGGRPPPRAPPRWPPWAPPCTSPVSFVFAKSGTKNQAASTRRWRNSPRTRWGTSLGPRSKGRSSRRGAFCSLSARSKISQRNEARARFRGLDAKGIRGWLHGA